jgi:hypothetical protein
VGAGSRILPHSLNFELAEAGALVVKHVKTADLGMIKVTNRTVALVILAEVARERTHGGDAGVF